MPRIKHIIINKLSQRFKVKRKHENKKNIIIILVYDIQLAKHEKKDTSILFMNIKGAFDHVSAN